ncbi:MAG: hypothetical protein H6Q87_356 [candidate division NC10 bacterium]|jgi:hypothetical protein|nr:hypothetical protein [candidate division NC10 bacterium]
MTARNGSEAAALNAHQKIAFDIPAPFSRLKSSWPGQRHRVELEGTGVEYVLIVSFALLIGFCLGVLVMILLETSDPAQPARRAPLRGHEVSPSRR